MRTRLSGDAAGVATGHLARLHFDQRGARYDTADIHHRVVDILVAGTAIEAGLRVLDVATGTGVLAIPAATLGGPGGFVVGVDISGGMLVEAKKKAEAAGLRNVAFSIGDAEALDLPVGSFDRVASASALVPMSDISHAPRHWRRFLKPGGIMAFDTPARPFGLSGIIAEVAADHGIDAGPCRWRIRKTSAYRCWRGRVSRSWLFGARWPIPARLRSERREAIRCGYIERVTAAAIDGLVRNDTALNFTFGRKPFDRT